MSKKITLFVVFVFVVMAMVGTSIAVAKPGEEIIIGAALPLTGPRASSGDQCKKGYLLAVDIINGVYDMDLPLARTSGLPNLKGRKIKLILRDHRGEPARGKAEAEKLITEDKVIGMVGSWSSGVTKTCSAAAERFGIPFVTGTTASMELTRRGYKWFFRIGPVATHFSKAAYLFLDDLRKQGEDVSRRVAVLTEDSEAGTDQTEEFKKFAKKYGYEITNIERYTSPPTSFDSELLRIRQANPDAIMATCYEPGSILLMQTLKSMNWFPKAVMAPNGGGFTAPDFLNTLGKDAEHVLMGVRQTPGGVEKKSFGKQLKALFREMFREEIEDNSLLTMTAVLVLANAINEAGSTEPEAIREALLKTDIPGERIALIWEKIKFDPSTHQNEHCALAMAQVRNMKRRIVWPFEFAEADYAWDPWK